VLAEKQHQRLAVLRGAPQPVGRAEVHRQDRLEVLDAGDPHHGLGLARAVVVVLELELGHVALAAVHAARRVAHREVVVLLQDVQQEILELALHRPAPAGLARHLFTPHVL